ncbi:MAG: hypothetical protein NDF54_06815 [archaeon GB-1867-035]|nr:hypothetical protein [Candidatus Culexmicrobium profundum]
MIEYLFTIIGIIIVGLAAIKIGSTLEMLGFITEELWTIIVIIFIIVFSLLVFLEAIKKS